MDSTYLLPVIGVQLHGIRGEAIEKLIDRGHTIIVNEISLFELSAKGAKYIRNGKLSSERVITGINAIIHDDSITKISCYEASNLRVSFILRTFLNDFVDCLIVSSGMNNSEILLSEDDDIHGLKTNQKFQELMATIDSTCKIMRLNEILRA